MGEELLQLSVKHQVFGARQLLAADMDRFVLVEQDPTVIVPTISSKNVKDMGLLDAQDFQLVPYKVE
jgi:hypothetical protein